MIACIICPVRFGKAVAMGVRSFLVSSLRPARRVYSLRSDLEVAHGAVSLGLRNSEPIE